MATIQEIVAEQSQKGDAALGGGTSGVITIDTSPVEKLAQYTMFANKADYDQRQKDVDAKVIELAGLTALDLNAAIGKDKDELVKDYTLLLEKDAREYATYVPTSQQDKLDKMLAFKDKISKLKSKLASATGRAISYNKQKDDLKASSLSPEERKRKQDIVEKKFQSTDIFTPVSVLDSYSFKIPQIPKSPKIGFDVTQKGANGAITSTYGIIDGSKADALASSLEAGFIIEPLPANPTPEQVEEYNQRKEAFDAGGASIFKDMETKFNQAFNDPRYIGADGKPDINLIKASNRVLADNISQIEYMNAYNKDIETKFNAGQFVDKTGINPAINFPNKNGYLQVDLTKPITAKDLIKADLYTKADADIKKEEYKQTNEGIQKRNLDLEQQKLEMQKKQLQAKTGKTQEQILSEMGNAMDSFGGYPGIGGTATTVNSNGIWFNPDGTQYSGNTRISGADIPDGIRNLIQQANPEYFKNEYGVIDATSKAATIVVKDGVVQKIQYDGLNPVDRSTIVNYQINEISKFTEKGNPFLPNYGRGRGAATSSRASENKTVTYNGNQYTLEEVKAAGYKDFDDFSKENK